MKRRSGRRKRQATMCDGGVAVVWSMGSTVVCPFQRLPQRSPFVLVQLSQRLLAGDGFGWGIFCEAA